MGSRHNDPAWLNDASRAKLAKKQSGKRKKKGSAVLRKGHADKSKQAWTAEELQYAVAAANDPILLALWRSIIKSVFPRMAPEQVDSYEPTKLQALAKRLNMTLSNNREHMTDLEEAVHNASFDTKPVDSAISVDDSADGMAAAAPAVQQPQPAPQAAPQPVPQAAPQPAQQTAPQQPAQARAQQQAPQPAQLPQPAQPDARLEPSDRRGITEMVTSAVTSVVSTSLAGSEQRMGGKIDKLASNMVLQNRQLRGELKETQTQVSALNRKYKLLLARFRSLRQKGSVPAGRNASPPYSPIASDLEDEGAASSGEVDAMEVSEAQAVQEQAAAQELQANAMQLEQQQAAAQALQPVPAPAMQQQQQQVPPPPPPPRAPQQGSPMGNVGSGAGRYQGDYRGAVMGTQQPNPAVKRALMKDLVRGHSDERNVQGMPLTRMPPEGAFDSVRGHVVNELSPEATRAMDVQNGDLLDGAKDCDRPLYDHLLQHPQLAAMGAAAWMHLPLVPADPPMYGSGPYGTGRDEDGAWQQTPSRSGGYHPGNQQKKGRWSGAKRGGQQGGQQGGWRQGGGDPGAGPSGQQQCRWCKQPGFTPAHLIDCNAYKDHLRRQSGK